MQAIPRLITAFLLMCSFGSSFEAVAPVEDPAHPTVVSVNSIRSSHDDPAPSAPLIFALDEPVLDEEDTELFGELFADADLPVLTIAIAHPASKVVQGSCRFTTGFTLTSSILRC